MVDLNKVKDILLDIPFISNIIIVNEDSFYGRKGYPNGIKCEIILKENIVKVFIGIPETWVKELVTIFIVDYNEMPFIPHVELNGKICLFDLEGVLIDHNFSGLIEQCVQRAKTILEEGLYSDSSEDFIKEFSAYWRYIKPNRCMRFAIPKNHRTQLIKYCDLSKDIKRKKNENNISFQKRKKEALIFAAAEQEYFEIWNIKGPRQNAIFIHINTEKYILPPDFRKPLQVGYIKEILKKVSLEEIQSIQVKLNGLNMLVIEISEPNGDVVSIGVILKGYTLEYKESSLDIKTISNNPEIIAVDIRRIDEDYLYQRIPQNFPDRIPKILVIGCGSIGGYLSSELVKSGYKNIDLIDDDVFSEENIYRHYLTISCVGKKKADALCEQLKKNYPMVKIRSFCSEAEEVIEEGEIKLDSYDVIISATGNHNFNRWLNKQIHLKEVETPCVYLWNEPFDVGCHLAIIQKNRPGCYECFFKRNSETDELYDATAFSLPGQMITKRNRGCSGSFVPYSSNVSLRIVVACMEWMESIVCGRVKDNVLVSIKGEAYIFREAGFKCSEVFYKQEEKEMILVGSDFFNSSCDICGENSNDY